MSLPAPAATRLRKRRQPPTAAPGTFEVRTGSNVCANAARAVRIPDACWRPICELCAGCARRRASGRVDRILRDAGECSPIPISGRRPGLGAYIETRCNAPLLRVEGAPNCNGASVAGQDRTPWRHFSPAHRVPCPAAQEPTYQGRPSQRARHAARLFRRHEPRRADISSTDVVTGLHLERTSA